MAKQQADKVIENFFEKIFGFAMAKTRNTDNASELAARITYDVYTSLLKTNEVLNIDGYVYRIAHNVYARYVDEEVRGRHMSLHNVSVAAEGDFTRDIEQDEIFCELRRRVSFLGKTRREVIVMYYFDKLKQSEIAKRLRLPQNTVKWHLREAKNELKEGLEKMEKIDYVLKPVKFSWLWQSGNIAPCGKDTNYYLGKLIAQNIMYATYFQDRTVTEIAEALNVPAAFVEDEVKTLEEFGFLDKLAGNKYRAIIFILNYTKDSMELRHGLLKDAAKDVCREYVPLVLDYLSKLPADGKNFYTPQNNMNFLRWSVITFACLHKLTFADDSFYNSKYRVKRKDGGEYVAGATIRDNEEMKTLSFDPNKYSAGSNMTRWGKEGITAWQLESDFDTRRDDYADNRYEDYLALYKVMTGLEKQPANADTFTRLYEKKYLVPNESDLINMAIIAQTRDDFAAALPEPPAALQAVSTALDKKLHDAEKHKYPAHMQNVCRAWHTNSLANQNFAIYVLAQLLEDGVLLPLTDTQKATVNTLMFCDRLPDSYIS